MDLQRLNMIVRKCFIDEIRPYKVNEPYTLAELGKVCDILKLPFFVRDISDMDGYKQTENRVYKDYNEFKEFLPPFYDENVGVSGIEDGYFEIGVELQHMKYDYRFFVTDTAILVRAVCLVKGVLV